MAENLVQLTVNTDTRRAVTPTTLNALKSNEIIRLIHGERPVIATTFVNKSNTAIAFGAGDTFEMNVDVDFTHDEYTGTLNAGYTGAVTSIAITFSGDMTGNFRDTGTITLQDTSNPSNRESVAYTAVVLSGASNEIGTFTVSKTLTNTYASGDYAAVHDRLMAQATESDVNTGEWSSADKTAGLVSFRLDCRDKEFSDKLAAQPGDELEYQLYMEIKRYPSGSSIPIVLMQDRVYGRQTVRDLEDVTIPSDENWTAADARYLKQTPSVNGDVILSADETDSDAIEIREKSGIPNGAKIQFVDNAGTTELGWIESLVGDVNIYSKTGNTINFGVNGVQSVKISTNGAFIANSNGIDIDTNIKGLTDDNLVYVDAGNDALLIGANAPLGTEKFLVSGSSVLDGGVIINESGADVDTRIEGTTDANLLHVDAGNNAVLISTTAPLGTEVFNVTGDSEFVGATRITGHGQIDGQCTINDSGGDNDTRIEGSTDANLVFVDAGNNAVGIGTNTIAAGYKMEVNGYIKASRAKCVMYVSSAAATASITSGTPVNLFANATIADTSAVTGITPIDFNVDNTGKGIDYTGTATKEFKVTAAISMTASVSNQIATFYVAKNGTYIAASRIDRKIGTGSDEGALALEWSLSLATNDSIEIYADLDVSSQTVTATHAIVSVIEC